MYATVMGLVAHAFQNNLSEDHNFASTEGIIKVDTSQNIVDEPEVQEQNPAAKKIWDPIKKFWDNL